MRVYEEPDDTAQINILPMIDVIFAILAFFIISTLFLTRLEGLDVNLPQASNVETQEQTEIVVTVTAGGEIALNRRLVELDSLATAIETLKGDQAKVTIIFNADQSVDYGQVVAVLDEIRVVEGLALSMSTEQPQELLSN